MPQLTTTDWYISGPTVSDAVFVAAVDVVRVSRQGGASWQDAFIAGLTALGFAVEKSTRGTYT